MKRVLFLMSDTGGGHRAAAEAIRDALYVRHGKDAVSVQLVDVYKHCLFPLNYMPEFYPWWVDNVKASWSLGYSLADTRPSAGLFARWIYFTSQYRLRRMVRQNPADVVVSVHSVITRPSMWAFLSLPNRPPFITVVTDLVSAPAFWYDRRVERCFVPTQAAYTRGLQMGMSPDQLHISGLPVNPQFNDSLQDKAAARHDLGWDADLPAVLMVAGGDGMGPMYKTARAINDKQLACQLVIITGRNHALREQLEAVQWTQPTRIYGFVTDMPRHMSAADILVTKAGPGTISEACIAGLPMILSDAIPGQEAGNVDHVVQHDAGVFAPSPKKVAQAVEDWLQEGPARLRQRADNARRLARPYAVWDIAEAVWEYAHHPPIPTRNRSLWEDLLAVPTQIFPTLS